MKNNGVNLITKHIDNRKRMFKGAFLSLLVMALLFTSCCASTGGVIGDNDNDIIKEPQKSGLNYFNSTDEIAEYLEASNVFSEVVYLGHVPRGIGIPMLDAVIEGITNVPETMSLQKSATNEASQDVDFSHTNVQVIGIDEGDFVKSDGKYFYVVREGEIAIVKAYPVDEAQKVASIKDFGINTYNTHLFLGEKKLAAITDLGETHLVRIYNMTDIENPVLLRKLEISGNKINTRQIGSIVYVISREAVKSADKLPWIKEGEAVYTAKPQDIGYFENAYGEGVVFNRVVAIDMEEESGFKQSIVLGSNDGNIYMSFENLYMTGTDTSEIPVILKELLKELCKLTSTQYIETNDIRRIVEQIRDIAEKIDADLADEFNKMVMSAQMKIYNALDNTKIYRFSIKDGDVEFKTAGTVKGKVLNQFSMDEHNGYFRIAVTAGKWDALESQNNLYVLNQDMKVVGELIGLAKGERIYSARFMGDKAYLITFRQIDPLFVIDLSLPEQPKLLGELKMPGFSDYLHPYDENHLIGIGKEIEAVVVRPDGMKETTTDLKLMLELPIVRTVEKGVKVSLFDVSDPLNPIEMGKFVIDNPSSRTLASQDHKAVLFCKEHNMLIIPVSYHENITKTGVRMPETEINNTMLAPDTPRVGVIPPREYLDVWHGVYVFEVSPEVGVKLKGKIEHEEAILRSMYIDKVLYTLSVAEGIIKASDMESLTLLKDIDIKKEVKKGKTVLEEISDYPPIVETVKKDLAEYLGVNLKDIKVVSVEEVEWSDSSLGVDRGGFYLQVITPGYIVHLEHNGIVYKYHTDRRKSFVRAW